MIYDVSRLRLKRLPFAKRVHDTVNRSSFGEA
jgi:hypothetical protein